MTEPLIYGLHAVWALLNNPHRTVSKLYVSQDRKDSKLQSILTLAANAHVPIEKLSAQQLQHAFPDFAHQGIVAAASPLPDYHESDLPALVARCKPPGLILILDGVTDPHNLGACLRSADAAGVDFVVIPKDKSASITPVVSKVACGAAESVPVVRVTNLVRALELLKEQGVWIYGAALEGKQPLYAMDCRVTVAIAMGAEGEGLRRLTREHCDVLFYLPMLGSVESLNVSVATGIALFEAVRQRVGDKPCMP